MTTPWKLLGRLRPTRTKHDASSEPAITLLFGDDEHAFRLSLGAQLSFSPDHWINMQQLVCMAAIASSEFDGRPALCQHILPGVDLCIMTRGVDKAALELLWPSIECFIERWIDTRAGQTQSMESFVSYEWVVLCRHGAETFDDVALTIERKWPSGVASAAVCNSARK